jgi:WD repeat-containing protein 44
MPEAATPAPALDPAGEDAGQQEEEFYESLDRILSSSCSSTSDDDADHRRRRRHHHHGLPHASAYDVWISEPTSVEERRLLLLQRLGLAAEPPPPARRSPPRSQSPSTSPSPPRPPEEPRSAGPGKPPLARNASAGGGEQCRIRNLDDGTEFEVGEEVHEEVVREVGTGRQLTLEEFELCIGRSPIVTELMRRATTTTTTTASSSPSDRAAPASNKPRRKPGGGWLRGIRHLAAYGRHGGGAEERDMDKEKKEARCLSSATHDSLDGGSGSCSVGRVRVRQYGKACKELTGLFMTQELPAHSGSVWCINFTLDGRYLATAGEDRVIHVWEVSEGERKGELLGEGSVMKENGGGGCSPFLAVVGNGSPEIAALSLTCADGDGGYADKKRRPRKQSSRKSVGSDHLVVPECVFGFRDKPVCSLLGHAADVLDLSWSKSQVRTCDPHSNPQLLELVFSLVLVVYILKHLRHCTAL